jgi:hypothetical protein
VPGFRSRKAAQRKCLADYSSALDHVAAWLQGKTSLDFDLELGAAAAADVAFQQAIALRRGVTQLARCAEGCAADP